VSVPNSHPTKSQFQFSEENCNNKSDRKEERDEQGEGVYVIVNGSNAAKERLPVIGAPYMESPSPELWYRR